MNMGLGLALGTAMGNPALGLALGAAMPDPYDSSSSYGRRRRYGYETDDERKAREAREKKQREADARAAARAAEDETLFTQWLKEKANAAVYDIAKAKDRADLDAINAERRAERAAQEEAHAAAMKTWRAEVDRQNRRRIMLCALALMIGVSTITIGFVVGSPWVGSLMGAALGGLGVWGAYAFTPWTEPPASPFGYFDRNHYDISLYEYRSQGFSEAAKVKIRAIRAMRRAKS